MDIERNESSSETGAASARTGEYVAMVGGMSEGTFAELIAASPRKTREALFQRLGIKAKKTIGIKVHAKTEDRTRKLHERLREAKTEQEDRLCEELVRNWLYTKRPLLKATLDWLGVKNDNGLIDEEPTFFQELTPEKTRALVAHLREQGFPVEHVALYLAFVKVPGIEELAKEAA